MEEMTDLYQNLSFLFEKSCLEGFQYGGKDTLGIFGWECAAGILEPLANTTARSSEFCYPIPD